MRREENNNVLLEVKAIVEQATSDSRISCTLVDEKASQMINLVGSQMNGFYRKRITVMFLFSEITRILPSKFQI